jgi:hypothetical protein
MDETMRLAAPKVPISWGELIDKITILEIKQINISAPVALANINKELDYLSDIVANSYGVGERVIDFKKRLLDVNARLWKVEDDIRDKELKQEFDTIFIELARRVYMLNDDRAKLKKSINQTLGSELVEEKSYKD